ncbi:MAG TPA: FAD-binding oxidoreductase, partial [Methylomirabilota bacterium]|nr:FAD-binding oxidoreductase [Methylomirabilota bacterium]
VATAAHGPLRARYGGLRDFLLGVRFVQADGVVTWGGARVVKSVTGYDVPKLMTGALGTLGVLVELTLRLHSTPEFEGTCLVTASHADAAQAFVAAVLDSALQPSRLEFLGAAALAACDLPPGPAAVAVSFSTVEAAVRAQQAALEPLAGRLGARVQTMGATFWRTYDRRLADAGPVTLRVTAPSSRLAATVREVEAALAAGGSVPLVAGGAAFGTLQASFAPAHPAAARTAVERLRDAVADVAGSVVVEKGPREVREAVDPWGPVAEPALALMRDLKRQFDPHGVLNPGRFVGGI